MRHADAIAIGEGEDIWPLILRDAEQGRLKPIYRAHEYPTLARPPLPRRDLLKQDAYLTTNTGPNHT